MDTFKKSFTTHIPILMSRVKLQMQDLSIVSMSVYMLCVNKWKGGKYETTIVSIAYEIR